MANKSYKVVVTIGNLFLPLDADGNCLVWDDPAAPTTKLLEGDTLLMDAELAKSLDKVGKVKVAIE